MFIPLAFHQQCKRIKEMFTQQNYSKPFFVSTIRKFTSIHCSETPSNHQRVSDNDVKNWASLRIIFLYKNQSLATSVRRHLFDENICPVNKIAENVQRRVAKHSFVNQQCVVYYFKCVLLSVYYYCAIQIMWNIPVVTFINLLRSTQDPISENHMK